MPSSAHSPCPGGVSILLGQAHGKESLQRRDKHPQEGVYGVLRSLEEVPRSQGRVLPGLLPEWISECVQ